ncbi:MAG: carboxy-S-adenosyl-L-methionine synthase CmoA [Thermodesulfobacteriota bacterium]
MTRDNIFQANNPPAEFSFDSRIAEVFDDMLTRSIPYYHSLIKMSISLLNRFCRDSDRIYDLGCSTGITLIEIAGKIVHRDIELIGIDASQAMIDKAQLKQEMFSSRNNIYWYRQDIAEAELRECGAILVNYTLQFLTPDTRTDLLKKIFQALRPGGILILSEKTTSSHSTIKKSYEDIYQDFKKKQGYSETEIARKRKALENILIPFTIQDNLLLMKKSGFSHVESFFQWFNFTAFLGLKEIP